MAPSGLHSLTVRDLPLEQRPRERLARGEDVSAQELIAVLVGRGVVGMPVMDLSHTLLKKFGSLSGVVGASLADLQTIPGLGPAKALQLKACLEIARQVVQEEHVKEAARNMSRSLAQPQDIGRFIRPKIKNWQKEHFYTVSFDVRQRPLGVDLVGVGTLTANLVHPREVFELAIGRHAALIVVAHNHPSGDPQPSEADILVTTRLKEAGEIMGMALLDHVILAKSHLYSFRENNLL